MVVNIYNPQWDYVKWSEYPNLNNILLWYRRIGDAEWRSALDASYNPISFKFIVPSVWHHCGWRE